MKKTTKRITGVLTAAAMILCAGTAATGLGISTNVPVFSISASAADAVGYINAQGAAKTVTNYNNIKSSTTKLSGGWYVASGRVVIEDRINVTDDSYIILRDGAKLIVKGGINVGSGVKFNVYTEDGAEASLFAGTTTGDNVTASNGDCGIGGRNAKVNLVGGKIYAVGGPNAYGIEGAEIHLYNTNSTDLVYASSYNSSNIQILGSFIDKKNGAAYSSSKVSASSLNGVTLRAANVVDRNTTSMRNGVYAVFGSVNVPDRITISGDVQLYLAHNATLTAERGITVSSGNTLDIYSNGGRLFAGTGNGSNTLAGNYNAGIGSENGGKCGTITINNGEIYANGGNNAAGIGGGNGNIRILGGEVNANGGRYGAGIGSGYNDNGADIKIYGGIVRAVGGSSAAGVGSGYYSGISSISLSYTNTTDKIYASSFDRNVTFMKTMYTSDGDIATANNISGKTLSPTVSTFKVYFETNGAGYVAPIDVPAGRAIAMMPYVVKNGYTFDGWYTDSNFRYKFNDNTAIRQSLTLYAKWSIAGYTVTFDANGGTFRSGARIDSRQVQPGKNAYTVYPSDPSYSRGSDTYQFLGWYYDQLGNRAYNGEVITSNTTLYASYQLINRTYTVTFNANGGTFRSGNSSENRTVESGSSAYTVYPSDPYFSNTSGEFEFIGWCYDQLGNRMYNGEAITSDTTLYASYSLKTPTYCTVYFDANGGTLSGGSSAKVVYGESVYVPDPYREGYVFDGWYTDKNKSNYYIYGTPVTSDITLYAGWVEYVPASYSVYIYVDDIYIETKNVYEGNTVPMNSEYYNYTWKAYGVEIDPVNYEIHSDMELRGYTGALGTASTFSGGGLIAAIAGGVVALGGGFAAGFAVGKKKKED